MRDELTGATVSIIMYIAGQGFVRLGGIFQFGFDKKIMKFFLASVSKKRIVFFGTFHSCKDGKILLNGVIKLLRVGRLE